MRLSLHAHSRIITHLEAEEEVKVFARTANRVTGLLVEEGEEVKKDQVLLRLLPVRAPEELVQLDGPGPFSGRTSRYGRSETEGSRLRPQGSRRLSPP